MFVWSKSYGCVPLFEFVIQLSRNFFAILSINDLKQTWNSDTSATVQSLALFFNLLQIYNITKLQLELN